MNTIDKESRVKILVVGDAGVGKSSLVKFLKQISSKNQNSPGFYKTPDEPASTIGAQVDVILHSFNSAQDNSIKCLEFWDVAGSHNYQMTRKFFYNDMNGIILVHDLNNKMSLSNLRSWLREVVGSTTELVGVTTEANATNPENNNSNDHFTSNQHDSSLYDMEAQDMGASRLLPILLVGMKHSQIKPSKRDEVYKRCQAFAKSVRASELHIDTDNNSGFTSGSTHIVKLHEFFDQTVFHSKNSNVSRYTSALSGQTVNSYGGGGGKNTRHRTTIKMD